MDNNTVYCNNRNTENLNLINRENNPNNVYAYPTPQNIVYKSDTLAKVYDCAFGDAIDDYNSKSTRKGEKTFIRSSYFEYLFGVSPDSETAQVCLTSNKRGSDKTRSFNEVFVQIGDRNEFGHFVRDNSEELIGKNGTPANPHIINTTDDETNGIGSFEANSKAEIAKEVLKVFYHGGHYQKATGSDSSSYLNPVNEKDKTEGSIFIPSFEERNQNFHVVTAIQHNDDLFGVPYLHIKFVPVGTNYVKGPSKQLGFHRALADMGFTNKQTAFTKWIQKESYILETICSYYGIEANTEHKIAHISDSLTEDCINELTARCKSAEGEVKSIIECAKQEASQIIEQAISMANAIKKEAEESANALKLKTEQEVSVLHEQADKKMSEVEKFVTNMQNEYNFFLERSIQLKHEIDFNRSSLLFIAEIAKKFPCEKFYHPHYDCERYEVDKYKYDLFVEFSETIVSLIKNHFTSYKDQKAIEHERKRAEQLNEQLENTIQEKEKELAETMDHYYKLVSKQKGYILGMAKKIAEQISESFAKQDYDTKIHQLNSTYYKVEAEEFNKRLKSNLPIQYT